jgi:hypothetical protein
MTKKFDPKLHQGKPRVYVPIARERNIMRLYVWDDRRKQYFPPETGKSFLARRWEIVGGKKFRKSKYHDFLVEARLWQQRLSAEGSDQGPTLSEVVDRFKAKVYPTIGDGTIVRYDSLLKLHFENLLPLPVRAITPEVVDDWISWLIKRLDHFGKASIRTGFRHELRLLTTLMHFYADYANDPKFVMPVVKRHGKAVRLRIRRRMGRKDMTDREFDRFAERLEKDFGLAMRGVATCQYENPGRISEPAALTWKDVHLDLDEPRNSRVAFRQHVLYLRSKDRPDRIEPGLKNSEGEKEHPVLPRLHRILKRLSEIGACEGLVFSEGGKFIPYRRAQ